MIYINVDKIWNTQIYDNELASQHNGHGWVSNIYTAGGRDTNYDDTNTVEYIAIDDSMASVTTSHSTRVLRGTTGGSNGTDALYGTGANGGGLTGQAEKFNLQINVEVTISNSWTGLNRYFKSSCATKNHVVWNGGEDLSNATSSHTRYLRFDDTVSHLGLGNNTNLSARSRAQMASNGLDALVAGGVSTGPNTAFGTTIERFRADWSSGDSVFNTVFNNNISFNVRNGAAVSSGESFIIFGGRNLDTNSPSTQHSKITFDDTAVTDIPTPSGIGAYVMIGGVMSGDAYYSVGGFNASGQVTKYKDSDTASATVFTNSMSDRQMHATFGGY